jgi:hypothetical protein
MAIAIKDAECPVVFVRLSRHFLFRELNNAHWIAADCRHDMNIGIA